MNDLAAQARLTQVEYDPFQSEELARAVPTTEAQREVWLADQLSRDASLAYNESVTLSLKGQIDVSALQNALLSLTDRHEALRSTLSEDGVDMLIAPRGTLQANVVDLHDLGGDARGAALARLKVEAVETPFDLQRGPLVRATLVKLGRDSHELLLTAHHIVCDGWSFGVLAKDLASLYEPAASHQAKAALPLVDSFGDYALALLEEENIQSAQTDNGYWVGLYDGSVPVLELPTDRPRAPLRSFRSRRIDVRLDVSQVDAVRKLGTRNGASLFVTLFAMFSGLMGRLAGSGDVVVGVPAAGQSAHGKDQLVGHCVHLLPIRASVDTEQSVAGLIGTSRGRVLDAYEHQSATFGSILKKLQVDRDSSRLPLVSVLFNLDSAIAGKDIAMPGLEVELRSNPRHFENFDIFLNASQTDGSIELECQFNTDLFDTPTVERWLDLYRVALQRACSDDGRSVAEVFAPTDDDMALLQEFNRTAIALPTGVRVEAMIARQAASTPDAVAIRCGDRQLSYRELDRRADALASALRSRGVGAGRLVGLCCGRNEHMLVGLVGILKSGAGYVPLDPAFPTDRLEYMARDAALAHVVSDRSVTDEWKFGSIERIDVDSIAAATNVVQPSGTAEDIAYVIYTSGSTGRPKGVCVPHRSVVNLLESVAREPGMTARDRVLSVTTLSFDIAVSEAILPLTVGASIIVADRAQAVQGDRLRELIESQAVSFIDATPSTWRLLLAAGWTGSKALKAICTGEPLPPDLARELLPLVGELWNGYGPTETTVWSSFQRIHDASGPVPIGRPIANTQIHVVDAKSRPVPVGVIGELFIGGAGVTLGYHGRPDLTSERFLPDPFAASPGASWYRTGDLGRWRADGVLECLGRTDHQVKVRGYRIELAEIEANLSAYDGVRRAVVVTREDQPGDVRIVAYVVAGGATLVADALREHLRRMLPEYMIPQHLVELPGIPLLPNGKIDRKALPAPPSSAVDPAHAVEPGSELDRQVVAAVRSVLKLSHVGMTDDFFRLGGHSLLAAKLIAKLNKEMEIALPMRTAFESTTPRQLVEAIQRARADGKATTHAPVAVQADQARAPLTVGQERIRFMEELRPGRDVYNTPSAHRLRGPMNTVAFDAAFSELIQRQPALRTVVAGAGDQYEQRVRESVEYSLLPVVDLTLLAVQEREPELMRRLEALISVPFDLTQGPLFSAALFKLEEDHHAFFFMTHHIIWDGWSFDLLYEELAASYAAALQGRASALPRLPVSFVDYAHHHHAWLESDACREQITYWQQRFEGAEPTRDILTDMPRKPGMSGRGGTEWVRVDRDLTERLRLVARGADATLNMATLAAYAAMLHSTSQSRELTLGIPVRGRFAPELEPVMGFFNNLLPMRLRVDPSMTFVAWMHEVKEHLLGGLGHQDVPFERLVQEVGALRDSASGGYYQALFSFQDARDRTRTWGSLQHESILVFQQGATEDLGLWLMEVPKGLEGGITYNADLFRPETAVLFRARYLRLLERIAADPHRTLAELLATGGDEQRSVDAGALRTDQSDVVARLALLPVDACDRPALSFGGARWSFAQLAAHAAALAASIREQAPAAKRVAVQVTDPMLRVAAWFGVWQAGATCVMSASHEVDPGAGVAAIVTDGPGSKRGDTIVIVINADAASSPLAAVALDPLSVAIEIVSAAAPVSINHGELAAMVGAVVERLGVSEGARWLVQDAMPEPAFCADVLAALAKGGEAVVLSNDDAREGDRLREQIVDAAPQVAHLAPRIWRALLDAWWSSKSQISVILDGRETSPELADALIRAGANVWTTHRPSRVAMPLTLAAIESSGAPMHMGVPLVRGMLSVLGDDDAELPVGVPGRLHARFAAEAAAQDMCDAARWRADGRLVVFQDPAGCVLLHGHLVDLAGLDRRLKAEALVEDSVSIVTEQRPGDRRLELYVVAGTPASFDSASARAKLAGWLPAAVPVDEIHVLSTMPRLADGRPDRAALLARVTGGAGERAVPSTPTELALAEVWSELLGVARVELSDNFFDLGGSSLLAMQAAERVAKRIGRGISPRRYVFETLAQLALAYDSAEVEASVVAGPARAARKGLFKKLGGLLKR